MTSITNAQLEWNEVGTPVSEHFDDVYFSNVNGLEETRYVFLRQNHLPQRWEVFNQRRFVIAETGFGTGLNFLAVWHWFEKFRDQFPTSPLKELHFISFEKFPLKIDDLVKAHAAWPELEAYAKQLQEHYPIAVPECHRIILAEGMVTLDLWFGDIKNCLPQVPVNHEGLVDVWFLDGFAPSKNPEMWNQALFNGMAQLAKQDCTCATFTSAGFVRRGLIEAGFNMKKVKGFGTKREMIAGALTHKQPHSNIAPWYAITAQPKAEDVAIIGGGIASAALAATLCQRGIPVTLYCKDEYPAQNASGNRQGALYPLLHEQNTVTSRLFAPAFLFARQFYDKTAQHFSFDHDWCGVTHLGWNPTVKHKLNQLVNGNYPPELVAPVTQEKMSELVGLPVPLSGIHYPKGGWLAPQELTCKLIDLLVAKGQLTLVTQTEIERLEQNEDKSWSLISAANTFQHQIAIVANGHLANQFSQTVTIPQSPVKGQVSHIPTTENLQKLRTVLCYNGYMTPHNPNSGSHCIGASHDRVNIDQAFDTVAQQENVEKLQRSIPDSNWVSEVNADMNQSKQGIRSTSRDHLPFVGRVGNLEKIAVAYKNLQHQQENVDTVASYDNLYCILALGGRGLCSAPLMAEVLASMICNDPLPLPKDCLEGIHPARFWIRKLLKGKHIA